MKYFLPAPEHTDLKFLIMVASTKSALRMGGLVQLSSTICVHHISEPFQKLIRNLSGSILSKNFRKSSSVKPGKKQSTTSDQPVHLYIRIMQKLLPSFTSDMLSQSKIKCVTKGSRYIMMAMLRMRSHSSEQQRNQLRKNFPLQV